uniref:C2H2-type domain-containing protein n=1 Tax=Bionectria ochroleuca TaxID=29856 RepID=A0A0B7KLH4_BIOOC
MRPRAIIPPCRFCGKLFQRTEHLRRHERTLIYFLDMQGLRMAMVHPLTLKMAQRTVRQP